MTDLDGFFPGRLGINSLPEGEPDVRKHFGARLRSLRLGRALTQLQLAQRVGISDRHLSRMERGLVSPSFECIENLCQALGTSPAELFQFPGPALEPARSARGLSSAPRSGQPDAILLEALSEAESILKSLPGLTVKCVDRDMRLVWMSTADTASRLGDAEFSLGKPCHEAAQGLDAPCPGCLLPEVLRTGKSREGEVTAPNGRFFLTRCNPVLAPDGRVRGAIHVALDISARKRMEEQLRSMQQRLEHLLNTGPAVLYACKASGNYGATYISDNMMSLFGHPAHAFLDNPDYWAAHLYPGDRERLFERLPVLFEQGSLMREYRFRHGNGSWRFIREDLRLVRDEDGVPLEIVGSWLDITDAKASELAMRDSELRYKNLFMTNCTVQLLMDAETGAILDANPAACDFYGYPIRDLRNMAIYDINMLPPDELAGKLAQARTMDKTLFRFRHRLANGETRDVESRVSLMSHGGRAVLHSLIIDVTGEERAQHELREVHRAWEMFFDNAPNALALLDENQIIQRGNELLAMILDMAGNQVLGARCQIETPDQPWPGPGRTIVATVRVQGFKPTFKATITALESRNATSPCYLVVSERNFMATK